METIQRVRFTKSWLRQARILEKKGPPLGKINVKVPHLRSPYAMKFEERSHEETERHQRCAPRSHCEYWHPPERQIHQGRIGLQSRG